MCSGEGPIGAARGKQSDTEALCQPPSPPHCLSRRSPVPWGCRCHRAVLDDVPACLLLDRLRVQQMLGNLLSTAIKFTDRGAINVVASAGGRRPTGPVQLRVEVTDTGIGMSPQQQERLFAPFSQADGSITRRFGGTGIGLSLVKGFAELMGGTAGCRSGGAGAGSSFWFTVRSEAAGAPREVAPALSPRGRGCVRNGRFSWRMPSVRQRTSHSIRPPPSPLPAIGAVAGLFLRTPICFS